MSQDLTPGNTAKLTYYYLTKNSFLLIFSNLGGAVLSFGISILIGRGLGKIDLGNWTFIFAWVAVISLVCEFGTTSLLIRESSRAPGDSNKLLIAALTVQIFLIGIFGMMIWALSPVLSINAETLSALRIALIISFAGIIYGSFTATFRSAQWIWPILWINIIGLFVQLFLSILVSRLGGTLVHLVWVAAAVDIAQLFFAVILWWGRIRPNGGEIRFSIDKSIALIKHATPFAAAGILAAVQMRSPVMLLSYLKSTSELGLFGAASRWSEAAKLIPYGIFGALYPAFATKHGAEYYKKSAPVIQILAVSVTLVICLFSRPVLFFSYGAEYIQGAPILFWLGAGLLPSLLNGNMQAYLYAVGREKYATKMRGFAIFIQVLAGFPLIYFYGAVGAAISILLGEVIIWFPLLKELKKIM